MIQKYKMVFNFSFWDNICGENVIPDFSNTILSVQLADGRHEGHLSECKLDFVGSWESENRIRCGGIGWNELKCLLREALGRGGMSCHGLACSSGVKLLPSRHHLTLPLFRIITHRPKQITHLLSAVSLFFFVFSFC
jgi:hypothetical protein